ncbi:extracellular matrix/biofilm biosynthesis regulator RemA family protein [Chloroflexota bacterium]
MSVELVHIGFDNYLAANRIIAIASVNSASIKRAIKDAQNNSMLVDLTHGRKTRTAIVTDTNHIFLSSRAPEIIAGRLQSSHMGSALKFEPEYDRVEV